MERSYFPGVGSQVSSPNLRYKKTKRNKNNKRTLRSYDSSAEDFLLSKKMVLKSSRSTFLGENTSNNIVKKVSSSTERLFTKLGRKTSSLINHSTESETPNPIPQEHLTVMRKKEEVEHNCHFFLEEPRMYTIFSKMADFEFKSMVYLAKGKPGSNHRAKTLFMSIKRGTLRFDIPNTLTSDPTHEIKPHNITDIMYPGQDKCWFSFQAFVDTPPKKKGTWIKSGANKEFTKFTYKVTCSDSKSAKRWTMFLLMTCESYGDVIATGMEQMQAEGLVKRSFEHIECMLKKRLRMYRLSLPKRSNKLIQAKRDLAEHLMYLRKTRESFELFSEIEEDDEIMQQGISGIISQETSVSALESLKMETKYVEALFEE